MGARAGGPHAVELAAQLERTALAWRRSLLALAVNGALLIKVGYAVGAWSVWLGSAVLVLSLVGWAALGRAYHALRGSRAPALLATPAVGRLIALVSVGVGFLDVAVIMAYSRPTGG